VNKKSIVKVACTNIIAFEAVPLTARLSCHPFFKS